MEILVANFAEKGSVKMADLWEFSGQISLERDRFCTDLTNIFKYCKKRAILPFCFWKMMSALQ